MEAEIDSTARSRVLVPACGKVVFCSRALRHSGPDAGMETEYVDVSLGPGMLETMKEACTGTLDNRGVLQ